MSAAAAINMLQRGQPSQYPDQSEESAHFHTLNQVKLILTVNDDAPLISHYSTVHSPLCPPQQLLLDDDGEPLVPVVGVVAAGAGRVRAQPGRHPRHLRAPAALQLQLLARARPATQHRTRQLFFTQTTYFHSSLVSCSLLPSWN